MSQAVDYVDPTSVLKNDTNIFTATKVNVDNIEQVHYKIPNYCLGRGNIKSVECIDDIACAVNESGQVFCSRENHLSRELNNYTVAKVQYYRGELYFITDGGKVLTPTKTKQFEVLPLSNIQDMLSGHEHSLFISHNNTFYFLGSNLYNQAAKADPNIQRYYEMVALDQYKEQIRKVSAGGWHNIVVLHSNKLVAWGYNLDSRCGADKLHRTHIEQPAIVPLDFDVLDASAGQWHTVALSTKGEAYAWGLSYGEALSVERNGAAVATPVKVKGIHSVDRVYCYARSNRNIVRTSNGEWFTWGKDSSVIPVEEGQIGMVHKIKKMEGVDKITVTSSGNCFFFVAIPKILVRRIQRFADLVFITVE